MELRFGLELVRAALLCRSFTSLSFLSTTTPSIYSLVGSLNKVPLALLGLFAFNVPWTLPNLMSVIVGERVWRGAAYHSQTLPPHWNERQVEQRTEPPCSIWEDARPGSRLIVTALVCLLCVACRHHCRSRVRCCQKQVVMLGAANALVTIASLNSALAL